MLLEEFEEVLRTLDLPKYRARQIFSWIHRRNVLDYGEMTDLSTADRVLFRERFPILTSGVARRQTSADGTIKALIALRDGNHVETVLIRDGRRNTICVSTQVGCPVRCRFCASGLEGLIRHLTASEIVEQFIHIRGMMEGDLHNVVFMGMGEPLLNPENVIRAMTIVNAGWGMGIGMNRITLSTVGVLKGIDRLMREKRRPNLAVSLHAPSDAVRKEIVPEMKATIDELIEAGVAYRRATGKDVTFEYVIIAGVNDRREHAAELAERVRRTGCKINVIVLNPVAETGYRPPVDDIVRHFENILIQSGVRVTVRQRKGDDIDAACGQLRLRSVSDHGS